MVPKIHEQWRTVGFGANYDSELGLGYKGYRFTPAQIGTDVDWARAESSYLHTIAIKADGGLFSWGNNDYGQLGIGPTRSKMIPVPVGSDKDWVAATAGYGHTVAQKSNGELYV